jgi:hypothetical protein
MLYLDCRAGSAASLLLLERCLGRCFDVVIVLLFLCGYCEFI